MMISGAGYTPGWAGKCLSVAGKKIKSKGEPSARNNGAEAVREFCYASQQVR